MSPKEIARLREEIKELSEYKQMYQSIAGKANLKHLVESGKALQSENTKLKEENDRLFKQLVDIAIEHPCYNLSKELESENEKLKKSRKVLRSAFEVIARGESQFDNVDHMYTAREALKADDEIMEGK